MDQRPSKIKTLKIQFFFYSDRPKKVSVCVRACAYADRNTEEIDYFLAKTEREKTKKFCRKKNEEKEQEEEGDRSSKQWQL